MAFRFFVIVTGDGWENMSPGGTPPVTAMDGVSEKATCSPAFSALEALSP